MFRKKEDSLSIYEREERLKIDRDVFEREKGQFNSLHTLRKQCVDQTAELAHEFHDGKEKKMTEIARLDAEIINKKSLIIKAEKTQEENITLFKESSTFKAQSEAKEVIIASLKEQVVLFNDLVKVIVGKLPKVELDKLSVNVNSTTSAK